MSQRRRPMILAQIASAYKAGGPARGDGSRATVGVSQHAARGSCITETYTRHFYGFAKQCHPSKCNKI